MSEKKSIKKIVFTNEVYKGVSWDIPIEVINNRFITGQDLTTKQMKGEEALKEEELKKYPHVINPDNFYKIQHRTPLDMDLSYDRAIYGLIIISKQVAKSKVEYEDNPQIFIGYFFDELEDAIAENSFEDDIFEATKLVRSLPIERLKTTASLFNYLSSKGTYIPVKGVSTDIQKNRLLKACRETPGDVMKCFPEHNKGIGQYGYILELIEMDIIMETASKEFMFESKYLGPNIDEVIITLDKQENKHLKQIFDHRLALKKGTMPGGDIISKVERKKTFTLKLKELKSLSFDERHDEFVVLYNQTTKEYMDLLSEQPYRDDFDKIQSYYKRIKLISDKNKLIQKLADMDMKSLHASISSAKSVYVKEECESFWEDEDKLREYMINIKHPNA